QGIMRPDCESENQFAEYHRSKALAEAAVEAVGRPAGERAAPDLDEARAATEFTAWLREHRPDLPEPFDLAEPADLAESADLAEPADLVEPVGLTELVQELAESWEPTGVAALYHTCSPHRVALTALHLRNYYQDEFADQLTALLPDWVSWL